MSELPKSSTALDRPVSDLTEEELEQEFRARFQKLSPQMQDSVVALMEELIAQNALEGRS